VNRRAFLVSAAAALAGAAAPAKMRGMQLHLSCGALGIKANQRQAVDLAAENGFDLVDADGNYLGGLSDGELKDLLGYMESKKVGFAMAGLPVEFRRDDTVFNEGMGKFPAFAKGIRRAGVRMVTTYIMPGTNNRPYLANFKLHAARLGAAARILADHEMRLGLEYVGTKTIWTTQRYPFAHTMAEMRELIAEMKQPNVGFVLDCWHWFQAGDTVADITALQTSDVVSVDLNDAPAGVPKDQMVDGKRELPAATGVIDVKAFLGALEKIGFEGPVRVEPFNDAVRKMAPQEAAAAAMAALKKAGVTG
jgi:sugar phosphate isomerase/epimerase